MVTSTAMVCVQDSTGVVLSLPPLTNCEPSKVRQPVCRPHFSLHSPLTLCSCTASSPLQVDASSHDLLLEVTSGESLAACKSVMDSLIVGMCEAGLVGSDGVLSVEQGRVVEEGGKLLVLYPSRTDLSNNSVDVRRP